MPKIKDCQKKKLKKDLTNFLKSLKLLNDLKSKEVPEQEPLIENSWNAELQKLIGDACDSMEQIDPDVFYEEQAIFSIGRDSAGAFYFEVFKHLDQAKISIGLSNEQWKQSMIDIKKIRDALPLIFLVPEILKNEPEGLSKLKIFFICIAALIFLIIGIFIVYKVFSKNSSIGRNLI